MEKTPDHRKLSVSREASDLAVEVLESFHGKDDDVVLNAIARIAASTIASGAVTREELFESIGSFAEHIATAKAN